VREAEIVEHYAGRKFRGRDYPIYAKEIARKIEKQRAEMAAQGPRQAPRQGEIWAAPSAVASAIASSPPSTPPRPQRGILNRAPTCPHPLWPSTPPLTPPQPTLGESGAPPGTDSPLKRGRHKLSLSASRAKEHEGTFGEQAWRKSKLESERATGLGDNQFAAARFGMQMHKQQMASEEELGHAWDSRCNPSRRRGAPEADGGAYGPSRKLGAPSKQEFVGLQGTVDQLRGDVTKIQGQYGEIVQLLHRVVANRVTGEAPVSTEWPSGSQGLDC